MVDISGNKRLNYFTGQLLNENDFKDEQRYHVDELRSHNKNLHTWGIAQGLNIEKIGKKNVTVSIGMAIDSLGRQVILDHIEEIDLSTSTATELYLTISYAERETEFKEEDGEKGYTRITEEPVIEYDQNKPDEPSKKIILAKLVFDREKDVLKSIDLEDRKHSGNVGGDVEAKNLVFSLPVEVEPDKKPRIRGVNGSSPGMEIISENTLIKGNLNISGTLTGKLDRDMVGTDQLAKGSITISRLKTLENKGSGEIGAKSTAKVEFTEPSTKHRFFITSVIPKTPDSSIRWWWEVEREKDQISYVLVVKNLSDNKIDIEFKYFELLEQ